MNDRLDRELARLRDDLHAEARQVASTDAALADVRAGVTAVTPLPPPRRLWLAAAMVVATAAAVAGAVVLSRDDRDAVTIPVTDPTTVSSTTPETTAVPDTTTAPTEPPTTTVAVHTQVPVQPQSVTGIRSISYSDTAGGWAIVELGDGEPALIRTARPSLVPDWVIADSPVDAADLSQVTFADEQNGWLVGAQHWWSTHDGGATWNQLPTADSGDAPLEVVAAGGWALIVRAEPTSDGPFAVRVWRSPIGQDDFRPTDAVAPKGAGGNDVTLSAAFDGTDVLVALNDRGGTTMRIHDDGTAEPLANPAIGRGGDIALESAPSGGAVWVMSQTGAWGGDATPQQVIAVSRAAGEPFTEVTLPEAVDLADVGIRPCGLAQFDGGSTALVICDAQGARQYRSADLGVNWEPLAAMTQDGNGQWSGGGGDSPLGPLLLHTAFSPDDGSAALPGVWAIVSSTDAWISILGA